MSNQVGVKVRSLFSEITLKYGNVSELPRTLELLIPGWSNPDCLFTDGSGWKNLGRYNTGKS